MKKLLLVLCVVSCSLSTVALAHIDNAGYVEANLDSVTSSYTPHNWGTLEDPPKYRLLTKAETDNGCDLTVGFRVRDDSRLAGYSNKVEGSLYYFNFATQAWVANGSTFTKTGSNTRTGKYNNFESYSWRLAQPYPVTKYSLGLVADTKGIPTKKVWKEFYVAKAFPLDPYTNYYYTNKSMAVLNAVPRWYASRMEIAQMLRRLKTEWEGMSTQTTTVNFDEEMKKILQSAASLAGPTTPSEYAQNSGLEVLSLAASVFGSATMSTMMAAGGEIYEVYQTYKWCTDTLNNAINTFNGTLNSYTMYQATVWANRESNPGNALQAAVDAVEAEANELIRITYTNPDESADNWKTMLGTERDKFEALAVSVTSARGTDSGVGANGYLTSAGASGIKDKVNKYFDIVWKLAINEKALLAKATQ